jgi:DSBA-like thioredoxin domain
VLNGSSISSTGGPAASARATPTRCCCPPGRGLVQPALEDDHLRRYAADVGLDVARFDRDRAGVRVLGRVWRDVESGMASGEVRGTPTLFIDGVVHRGAYDATALLEALAP